MKEVFTQNSGTSLLALSLFTSGILGSWHCAAMCGPLVCLLKTKKQLALYHAGRVFSYSTLGLISGQLGFFFLQNELPLLRILSIVVLTIVTFILILQLLGYTHIFKFNIFKSRFLNKLQARLYKVDNQSGFSLGFFSILLPCGWLYSFVAGASATQSPWAGLFVMLIFALTGIPALSFFPTLIQNSLKFSSERQKKISAFVLTISALYSLVSFFLFHM